MDPKILRQQADEAIAAGHDPAEVNAMYLDDLKNIELNGLESKFKSKALNDDGVERLALDKKFMKLQADNAIKFGHDPNEVNQMLDDDFLNADINYMLKPRGIEKVGVPIAAAALGGAQTAGKIIGGAVDIFTQLGEKFGLNTKETTQKVREFNKGLDESFMNEPVVRAAPGAAFAGGMFVPGLNIVQKGLQKKLVEVGLEKGAGVVSRLATNAGLGATLDPEHPLKGAGVGLLVGAAGEVVGAAPRTLQKYGNKAVSGVAKANKEAFVDATGVQPSFAQITDDMGIKRTAQMTSQIPFAGGAAGKTQIPAIEANLQKKVKALDPGDTISFIDKFDPDGKMVTVDDIDKTYLNKILERPEIKDKVLPLADGQMHDDIVKLYQDYKKNYNPSTKPTEGMKALLDLAKVKDATLEGVINTKRGMDKALDAIRKGKSTLPAHEQDLLVKAVDIVKKRTERMANQLGVGKDYQAYNKWFNTKKDYETIAGIFDKSKNPQFYDQFDPQKMLAEANKALNKKGMVQTVQGKKVLVGVKKMFAQLKNQREEYLGVGGNKILKTVGGNVLGAAGVIGAFAANPTAGAAVAGGLAVIRLVNKALNSPRGLQFLERIGNNPNGTKIATDIVNSLTKAGTIGLSKEQQEQGK